MLYQEEQLMKERAMKEQQAMKDMASCATPACGAILSTEYDEPRRESLRDRVAIGLRRAERETGRAMRLSELEHLLNKHPEIARILELMEEVRV